MTAVEIRKRSASLRNMLSVLFAVLVVLLALENFSIPLIELWRAAGPRSLYAAIVGTLPDVFYLAALWGIRTALAGFAKGDFFTPTIATMLNRVGIWLAAGAIVSLFVAPLIMRVLGSAPGYWIAFDVSGLVLGAVGLSLTVVSRVLTRAGALQTELDEMF
jgi:hypothetical protein